MRCTRSRDYQSVCGLDFQPGGTLAGIFCGRDRPSQESSCQLRLCASIHTMRSERAV
jgi:hypothetical protein